MSTKQISDVINNDNRIAFAVDESMPLNQAKALVKSRTGLNDDKIEVIARDDGEVEAKIEKSPQKLGKYMLSVHLKYSLIGLIIGMMIATALVLAEVDFTHENIIFTYIAFISPGIFIGSFVAGLMSLNPARDATNMELVQRNQDEKPSLLVMCQSAEQKKAVKKAVDEISGLSVI
jgi:hypothetical protein